MPLAVNCFEYLVMLGYSILSAKRLRLTSLCDVVISCMKKKDSLWLFHRTLPFRGDILHPWKADYLISPRHNIRAHNHAQIHVYARTHTYTHTKSQTRTYNTANHINVFFFITHESIYRKGVTTVRK